MSDALTDYLVQDHHHHARLSPEMLELLGKQASTVFLENKVPLTDAVVKLASAYRDINHEQVKRICEFANNSTYLALHDRDKTAGSNASYPQFPLADPARVIQDMSDGARPTVITPTDTAYNRMPEKVKTSSPALEEALAELFKVQSQDEVLTKESAADDVLALKNQLRAMKDRFASAHETCDLSVKEASADFYDQVKRHLLDGNGLQDVVVAVRSTGVSKEKVAAVLQPVIGKLMREKVASLQKLTFDMNSISKIAHRVVNQEHPMVSAFLSIVSSYEEMEKAASALSQVDAELGKVNAFIQENFLARAAS